MTAPSSRCDLRSVECTCESTECRAAKPAPLAAEIMLVPVKTQLAVCLFLGVIAGFIFYAAGSMADEHYRIEALKNQEVTHHVVAK